MDNIISNNFINQFGNQIADLMNKIEELENKFNHINDMLLKTQKIVIYLYTNRNNKIININN
jgi:hypothetical protein